MRARARLCGDAERPDPAYPVRRVQDVKGATESPTLPPLRAEIIFSGGLLVG